MDNIFYGIVENWSTVVFASATVVMALTLVKFAIQKKA